MSKALIIYATRTNQTKEIAQLLAEGMRIKGMEAELLDIAQVDRSSLNMDGYDALVIGAPTYHGDMMQTMKTFLFALEPLDLEGKVGGAFGAFGWSGEAPDRIFDTMKHIFKMKMVSGPLRLKSASLGGGIRMAHDYAGEIAKKTAE